MQELSQFQTDLTQGSVFGQLLKFSVPFLLSNLLQALYNMADMVIVGQFGGAVGASAVGIGGQVTILIINLIHRRQTAAGGGTHRRHHVHSVRHCGRGHHRDYAAD